MSDTNPQYDVAISFLSNDEPLALNLSQQLAESLSVFVYSERQKEIAGRDGVEAFRQVFISQSRVVVVLYREGYGKTKWTIVEKQAIGERAFETGWDFLFFVTLDQMSPPWIPSTYLRWDYTKFPTGLVGAIQYRVQQVGGELKTANAVDKAKHMADASRQKRERAFKLENESGVASQEEWRNLCNLIEKTAAEISESVQLKSGKNEFAYGVRTRLATVSLTRTEIFTRDFAVQMQVFNGVVNLPNELGTQRHYFPGEGPEAIAQPKFVLDYNAAHGWCWRSDNSGEEQLITSEKLSELVFDTLLQTHQDLETGKMVRRAKVRTKHHSGWNWP